jgi:hypothetical protein
MTRAIAVLAVSLSVGIMASASCLAEPAAADCEPSWARACAPATSGTAVLEGIVRSGSGFSRSGIVVMFRTTEGSLGPRTGRAEYGPWHSTPVDGRTGAFSLTLPACGSQVRLSGCIGGAYEIYASYQGRPCTEMWYASLIAGELDQLPENAFLCAHTSDSVASLTGEKYFEPMCTPSWVRNCLPGTAGSTSVSGLIPRPATKVGSFSFSRVAVAYRTVEGDVDGVVYGTTHYVKVGKGGQFALTLRACGVFAPYPSCDGGVVEAWPTYEHVRCGETLNPPVLIAGELQQLGKIACDPRRHSPKASK